jgi:hypothetical protein
MKAVADDPINNPAHYRSDGVECIDVIRSVLGADGFQNFCCGQVIKYVFRGGNKDGISCEDDLKKAAWYARMCIGDDPRSKR